MSTTRSQRSGGRPQASLVPVPRGTLARFSPAAAASTAPSSAVEAGRATQDGVTPATASAGPAGRTAAQAWLSAAGTGPAVTASTGAAPEP